MSNQQNFIITNQRQLMTENKPRFIKINPGFNQKNIALNAIFASSIPSEIPLMEVEPICANCQKWLRRQVKIITEKDHYCVGCFASTLPECDHYRVENHYSFQIIGGGWPVRDDLLLLQAIQRFGFGNWAAIQQYMAYLGANYFADQIQLHFDKFYGNNAEENLSFIESGQKAKVYNPSKKSKRRYFYGGKIIEKSTCVPFSQMNQQQSQSIPCYNSKRGEFNIEYKENLQRYIADLQFRQNDSQKEIELKFKILQAYNLGLEDRTKKHNFILEHRLLDQNYQAEQNKYLQINPYANKAHQLLIELMRTMTRQQYLELRKSVQFCLKIQAIIDSLRVIRSSGIHTTIKAISKFEKQNPQSAEMGKPRKRVHRTKQTAQQDQEKVILKKLNLNKEELKELIERAHEQNETVIYKEIKITPINNLRKESSES